MKISSPPPDVQESSAASYSSTILATHRSVGCLLQPPAFPALTTSTAPLSRHTLLSLQPVAMGSATLGSGLSWHRTLPLCVLGGDRKLCFWMTEM